MSVISTVPDAFTVQYESSFDLALQQFESKLRGAVTSKSAMGERHRINLLDSMETTDITTRGGDTVSTDLGNSFVSIFPTPAEAVNSLDEFDDVHLGSVVLPNSDIVTTQAAAVGRKIDNVIVAAMTGVRYLGKNGTTSEVFPTSTQRIAVDYDDGSTNTGLTFKKISAAAYLMDTNEVPEGGRYIGIRAKQMEDLVDDILTNHSNRLADIKMMENSRVITRILGFDVVQTQRWAVDVSDLATVCCWQKNEVVLGVWNDRRVHIDIRADKRHSTQIRTVVNIGATRKRNEGVVSILCDQSP